VCSSDLTVDDRGDRLRGSAGASVMAQIRENWTDITGRVIVIKDVPGQPGMSLLTVAVSEAREVQGFANFLAGLPGSEAGITMPVESAARAGCAVGSLVRCRVRRGRNPKDIFAHTDSVSCE
jgi:hypothetical protein